MLRSVRPLSSCLMLKRGLAVDLVNLRKPIFAEAFSCLRRRSLFVLIAIRSQPTCNFSQAQTKLWEGEFSSQQPSRESVKLFPDETNREPPHLV